MRRSLFRMRRGCAIAFLGCGNAIASLGMWECDRFDNEDFGGAIS
jgi:hypothetical protein